MIIIFFLLRSSTGIALDPLVIARHPGARLDLLRWRTVRTLIAFSLNTAASSLVTHVWTCIGTCSSTAIRSLLAVLSH